MVNIEGTGFGRRMIQNFKDLGIDSKAEVVQPKELRKRYPLFWDADYKEAQDCHINTEAGWAEAASALKAVIAEAVKYGVQYVEGSVSRLIFDDPGRLYRCGVKGRKDAGSGENNTGNGSEYRQDIGG